MIPRSDGHRCIVSLAPELVWRQFTGQALAKPRSIAIRAMKQDSAPLASILTPSTAPNSAVAGQTTFTIHNSSPSSRDAMERT